LTGDTEYNRRLPQDTDPKRAIVTGQWAEISLTQSLASCNQNHANLHFGTRGTDSKRDGTETSQLCTGWFRKLNANRENAR